jgi:hypothetical protein
MIVYNEATESNPTVQALYISGIQPGVRVPPGVREDMLGGTYN